MISHKPYKGGPRIYRFPKVIALKRVCSEALGRKHQHEERKGDTICMYTNVKKSRRVILSRGGGGLSVSLAPLQTLTTGKCLLKVPEVNAEF